MLLVVEGLSASTNVEPFNHCNQLSNLFLGNRAIVLDSFNAVNSSAKGVELSNSGLLR